MTPTDKPMTVDALMENTRLAWYLGQRYWQQADSESYAENRRSALTLEKFNKLLESSRAAIEQYGREREAAATRKPIEGDWRTGAINYLRAVADGRRIKHANVPHLLAHVNTIDRLVEELEIMQNASPYGLDCVPAPPFDPAAEPPWHRSDMGPAGRGSGEPVAVEPIIDAYLDGYETAYDEGSSAPDADTKFVIKDAIMGLLADDEFVKAVTPQPREPLTDEQIDSAIAEHVDPVATYGRLVAFARAIERAHGIMSKP